MNLIFLICERGIAEELFRLCQWALSQGTNAIDIMRKFAGPAANSKTPKVNQTAFIDIMVNIAM